MEKVLVIKRADLPAAALVNGFSAEDIDMDDLIPVATFIDRDLAEHDPTYKQIIPQIVVRNQKGEIFVVQRLKTQGESRLHGKHSIGIGGHINPIDSDSNTNLIVAGLFRELDEELDVDTNFVKSFHWIGTMNDDTNDVGTVHIAVVATITFDNAADVKIKETDKMTGQFMTMDEAAKYYDNMENWSQIIFNQIRKG
jgi:predicted NUDIX family phosphoesterase